MFSRTKIVKSPGKKASGPAKVWKSVKIYQKKARTLQTGSIKDLVKIELGLQYVSDSVSKS